MRCSICMENCRSCSNETSCDRCLTGYRLNSGSTKCIEACDSNCLTCKDSNKSECVTCYAGSSLQNGRCVADLSCNTAKNCTSCG